MTDIDKEQSFVRSGYRQEHGLHLGSEAMDQLSDEDYRYYYDKGKLISTRSTLLTSFGYIIAILVIGGIFLFVRLDHKSQSSLQGASQNVGSYSSQSTSEPKSTTSSGEDNGLDANGCYTPDTVRQYEGTSGCVDFNVGYTYRDSAGTVFIDQLRDYSQGMEIYIPYNSSAADIDLSQLQGKDIKATGEIQDYDGSPQVTVTQLSQIQIYQ